MSSKADLKETYCTINNKSGSLLPALNGIPNSFIGM